MLVLSRKLGEKVHIGKDIIVTVVDIDRGKIRLGFECPKEIYIAREEIMPNSPFQEALRNAGAQK